MSRVSSAVVETLETHNISVHFEGVTALDAIDLELRRDEVLGLIGPNGAGKTTLVNVVTGFQLPEGGRILLSGQDVTGWPPHLISRRGVARTFQAGRLFKEMPTGENVEVGAVSMGLGRRKAHARAMDILEWLGIAGKAHVPAGMLSHPDERRVGIARALAMHPRFVLLDEPAAGMSDAECDHLMRSIAQIPQRYGCGVLVIDHNMRFTMGVCNRIHVLDFGRTLVRGTPAEVQAHPAVLASYLGSNTTG